MTSPISTTAQTRAVLSSGVGLALEQAPILIVGDPGVPTTASNGYGVRAGLLAAVLVARPRLDVSKRRAWGVVTTAVIGDDYRVTVGADDVTFTAVTADDADILAGLQAAIIADVTLNAQVSTELLTAGPAGSVPHLLLVSKDDTDWTVLFDVDTPTTGAMATYAEPTTMDVDVFGKPLVSVPSSLAPVRYGTAPPVPGWGVLSGASGPIVSFALTLGGIVERVDVSGIASVYIRPHNYAGPSGEDPSVVYVPWTCLYVGVS